MPISGCENNDDSYYRKVAGTQTSAGGSLGSENFSAASPQHRPSKRDVFQSKNSRAHSATISSTHMRGVFEMPHRRHCG